MSAAQDIENKSVLGSRERRPKSRSGIRVQLQGAAHGGEPPEYSCVSDRVDGRQATGSAPAELAPASLSSLAQSLRIVDAGGQLRRLAGLRVDVSGGTPELFVELGAPAKDPEDGGHQEAYPEWQSHMPLPELPEGFATNPEVAKPADFGSDYAAGHDACAPRRVGERVHGGALDAAAFASEPCEVDLIRGQMRVHRAHFSLAPDEAHEGDDQSQRAHAMFSPTLRADVPRKSRAAGETELPTESSLLEPHQRGADVSGGSVSQENHEKKSAGLRVLMSRLANELQPRAMRGWSWLVTFAGVFAATVVRQWAALLQALRGQKPALRRQGHGQRAVQAPRPKRVQGVRGRPGTKASSIFSRILSKDGQSARTTSHAARRRTTTRNQRQPARHAHSGGVPFAVGHKRARLLTVMLGGLLVVTGIVMLLIPESAEGPAVAQGEPSRVTAPSEEVTANPAGDSAELVDEDAFEAAVDAAPEPRYVPDGSPYAVDVRDAGGTPSQAAAAPSGSRFAFGADNVTGGRTFVLRMTAPVSSLRGTTKPDGFSLVVSGSESIDPAGSIARAHPFVESASIENLGGQSVLHLRFVHGQSPQYRVDAVGKTLEVTIGS